MCDSVALSPVHTKDACADARVKKTSGCGHRRKNHEIFSCVCLRPLLLFTLRPRLRLCFQCELGFQDWTGAERGSGDRQRSHVLGEESSE